LTDVDQLDSIGIAKRDASGREIGARREESDIFVAFALRRGLK